jgi:hypothetical protein
MELLRDFHWTGMDEIVHDFRMRVHGNEVWTSSIRSSIALRLAEGYYIVYKGQ